MTIALRQRTERGYASVIMLGLISLILVVTAANTQCVRHLSRELNHLDQQQSEHWKNFGASTNLTAFPKS